MSLTSSCFTFSVWDFRWRTRSSEHDREIIQHLEHFKAISEERCQEMCGMVINSENLNYSLLIFIFIFLSEFLGIRLCWCLLLSVDFKHDRKAHFVTQKSGLSLEADRKEKKVSLQICSGQNKQIIFLETDFKTLRHWRYWRRTSVFMEWKMGNKKAPLSLSSQHRVGESDILILAPGPPRCPSQTVSHHQYCCYQEQRCCCSVVLHYGPSRRCLWREDWSPLECWADLSGESWPPERCDTPAGTFGRRWSWFLPVWCWTASLRV